MVAEPEAVKRKVSTTDSDSGLFVKGEHERCFAYSDQTACDKHGFVLDFEVGAGNLHDGQMFHELYKKMPAVPYTRPKTKDGFFRKSEYVYDEYFDCYLCPQNQLLKYTTTNREGYREYKSEARICQSCPCRTSCTLSRNTTKVILRHIWAKYLEEAEHLRHVTKVRDTYKKRKGTIERVFADAKERHCLRYTNYRGLAKVRVQVALK